MLKWCCLLEKYWFFWVSVSVFYWYGILYGFLKILKFDFSKNSWNGILILYSVKKLFQLNDQIWTSFKLSFGLAASAIIIQGCNRGKSPLTFCDVDRFLWLYLSYIDDIFFLKWFELVVVFTLLSKETGYLNIPKRKWKGNLFIETLWLKLLKDSWVKVMMNKFLWCTVRQKILESSGQKSLEIKKLISWFFCGGTILFTIYYIYQKIEITLEKFRQVYLCHLMCFWSSSRLF